jgi:hypothetical protein
MYEHDKQPLASRKVLSGVLAAPIFHRFLHNFHLADEK